MLTPAEVDLTPAHVIRAALTVITARGQFQPFDHAAQADPARTPTAVEAEALLLGGVLPDGAALARAASDIPPAAVDAIHRWALTPPADRTHVTPYRHRLARVAAADRITARDIPTLAAAVDGWQRSHHVGTIGEPITTTARVTTRITQSERIYRGVPQRRYLLRLRDALGRVLIWPARPKTGTPPEEGATITLSALVETHDWYGDTAQTYITRCRWKEPNDMRESPAKPSVNVVQ
ncbi:hypothetical protein [Streptomyces sp. NBC_00134]|uniref:hypothetical protein n=1 Tax=Streptomyces sp. NBC_00134 TaxID=2975663 RepID=UPI002F916255